MFCLSPLGFRFSLSGFHYQVACEDDQQLLHESAAWFRPRGGTGPSQAERPHGGDRGEDDAAAVPWENAGRFNCDLRCMPYV